MNVLKMKKILFFMAGGCYYDRKLQQIFGQITRRSDPGR